jgi:hypothetical protein
MGGGIRRAASRISFELAMQHKSDDSAAMILPYQSLEFILNTTKILRQL